MDLSRGGKQPPLGLPGSGLSYRSSRRPWGHGGAGVGASVVAGLAVFAAIVMAVVFFGF
jgi:hypothetical protein